VKVDAVTYRTHNPFEESHWVSRLRENLTSGSDGERLETGQPVLRQPFTRQLFFKALKQQLKVKSFVGTSKNALLSQLWIALIAYLLLCYLKFISKFSWSLYTLCSILPTNLFSRRNLWDWLNAPFHSHSNASPNEFQYELSFS
jgi:hypothetical protein